MAVYRLSDVAGDKNGIKSSSNILFFAWSVEHGEKGDCALNFRRLKLWTVGSFGIPRGTAQYSGYITTKGCVRLQRATRSGSMMQETPAAFLFFFSQRPKYANAGIFVYTSQTIKPATGKPGDGFTSALKGVLRRGCEPVGEPTKASSG